MCFCLRDSIPLSGYSAPLSGDSIPLTGNRTPLCGGIGSSGAELSITFSGDAIGLGVNVSRVDVTRTEGGVPTYNFSTRLGGIQGA